MFGPDRAIGTVEHGLAQTTFLVNPPGSIPGVLLGISSGDMALVLRVAAQPSAKVTGAAEVQKLNAQRATWLHATDTYK